MSTFIHKALSLAALSLLAGCAGMPDLKNVPGGAGALTAMIPGASRLAPYADSAVNVAKAEAEASREIPEDEEIAFGEKLMSGVLGAAPLYDNDRVQRYVNQVGRLIASKSERPNLPWRFAVLDSPIVNAGAAPGGQIYITTALLFRMRSEAELAGALAHEVAHVVQKHHLKMFQRQTRSGAWKGAGITVLQQNTRVGGGAVGQFAKNWVIELGAEAMRTILASPLDRVEEEQADRMAMVLAARAGYDPFGVPTTLQILQDVIGDQGSISVMFSTHPNPSDRLASLDKSIGRSMDAYASQATHQERFISTILGTPAAAAPAAPAPAARTPAKPPAKTPPKK